LRLKLKKKKKLAKGDSKNNIVWQELVKGGRVRGKPERSS